jgi:hypothetical protein
VYLKVRIVFSSGYEEEVFMLHFLAGNILRGGVLTEVQPTVIIQHRNIYQSNTISSEAW